MKKLFFTVFVAVSALMVSAQEEYGIKTYSFVDQGYYYMRGLAMSTDGRYIAGTVGYGSAASFVFDTETEDLYVYEPVSGDCEARGVSNTGVAATWDLGPMTISITGETVQLEGDSGEASFAEGITPDGTIVVGGVTNTDEDPDGMTGMYGHAAYWIDAKLYLLPEPTAKDVGLTVIEDDETDYSLGGTQATFISEDGSLIVGHFYDRWSSWPCIAWKLNEDGSYSCIPICKGYYQEDQFNYSGSEMNPYFVFKPTGLSKNGRYIALQLMESTGDNMYHIGRYDMETGTLEVADDDEHDFLPSDVANDGTILAEAGNGNAYIWRPGTDEPKRLLVAYPLATDLVGFDTDGEHIPMAITPDGRYIMGFAWVYDEATDSGHYSFYRFDTEQYEKAAGIVSVTKEGDDDIKAIYSVDGRRLNSLQRGINIVKKNGKTSKYLIR